MNVSMLKIEKNFSNIQKKTQILHPNVHTLFAMSSKPEYEFDEDTYDYKYIPGRNITIAHPDYATIILPESEELRLFVDFCNKTLHQTRNSIRAVFAPGDDYLLDERIEKYLIGNIQNIVKNEQNETVVYPYSVSSELMTWLHQLSDTVNVYGENPQNTDIFGHKGIMHNYIDNPNSCILNNARMKGVRIPQGYRTRNLDEAKIAYEKLIQETNGETVFQMKGIFGSSGQMNEKICSVKDIEKYAHFFEAGDVNIEQRLALEFDENGNEINCSIQYVNGEIFGKPTLQILDGTHSAGNIVGSNTYKSFQNDAYNQTIILLECLQEHGLSASGGFDFLLSGGEAWLIDPNPARDTAAHAPKHFQKFYSPDTPFVTLDMPYNLNVDEAWTKVESRGLQFNNRTGEGAYPLYHFQFDDKNANTSRWICLNSDTDIAYNTLREIQQLIG